ncbi:MAG: ANTAR domain-containing protein [Gammaproteobacteria bacterium]|nr:ANTAR domain-containing protein [Gammaproteobacteria bacterium]
MTLETKQLSIMLVDELPERSEIIKKILEKAGHRIVARASSKADLTSLVNHYHPDIIIIDMESPDRDTLEHMRTISADRPRPIVMFTNDEDSQTIRRAVKAGVTAYIVDGLQPRRVMPILEIAIARFNEFQTIKLELEKTKNSLEERKLVERAKGILMKQSRYDEESAYKSMRKLAMDRNMKLSDLARSIIAAAELLK